MKRTTGLAALFTCLAFASGAMAQERPSLPDPETAKILSSVGMTYDEARAAAGGRTVAVFYDWDNAAGEAFAYPGETSCGVSWSPEGENLSSGFTIKDAKAIRLRYARAIDRDIEKISMLHELSHCTQKSGDPNNEYDADEKALTRYLDQGGSRTTAQYWIYWRGLSPLLYPHKYAKSENYTPTIGPRLQAKFFGGEAPDPVQTRAAYDEILVAVKAWDKDGKKRDSGLIHDMLADKNLQLSPEARGLLQFYAEAYRYLSKGPARASATVPKFDA